MRPECESRLAGWGTPNVSSKPSRLAGLLWTFVFGETAGRLRMGAGGTTRRRRRHRRELCRHGGGGGRWRILLARHRRQRPRAVPGECSASVHWRAGAGGPCSQDGATRDALGSSGNARGGRSSTSTHPRQARRLHRSRPLLHSVQQPAAPAFRSMTVAPPASLVCSRSG